MGKRQNLFMALFDQKGRKKNQSSQWPIRITKNISKSQLNLKAKTSKLPGALELVNSAILIGPYLNLFGSKRSVTFVGQSEC